MSKKIAILFSGGLDSTYLMWKALKAGHDVYPIYIEVRNNEIKSLIEKQQCELLNIIRRVHFLQVKIEEIEIKDQMVDLAFESIKHSLEKSVYRVFQKAAASQAMDINTVIQSTLFDNISILPASTAIATLDKQLGSQQGMGLVLARQLLSLKDQYDYIFVDCPPMLGVLMINALAACNQLLIPVQTEHLALKGLDRMLGTLKMINRTRKIPLSYAIIPTMFDRRTRAAIECLRIMQKKYDPEALKKTLIPVDTKFREASSEGVPLPIYSPHTRGAKAYNLLLDTLLVE